MKIINVCHSDWANYSYANACALRSIGHNARALTLATHSFGYAKQADLVTAEHMLWQMKEADVIQLMHTCPVTLEMVKTIDRTGKKIVAYHTGTRFRQEPEKYNELFNPIIDKGFTDQTEFMKLGIKDVSYVAVAIDVDAIRPGKVPGSNGEKLIVAHYPSRSQVKGTEKIKTMLAPFADKFTIDISTEILTHDRNLERMQKCDIYIELFSPMQGDKEYGCFGVTSFEAAAMGKIVVTQNLNKDVYDNVYGEQDVLFSTPMNEHLFERTMNFLSTTSHINNMQKLTRETIVKRHSYQATGKQIADLLNI